MTLHSLGLLRETNTAAAGAAVVPAAGITGLPGGVPAAPAPPLPGRPPEALTPSGQIPLPAQLAQPKAPAPKSRIPKFSDDPLRSIAFALSEAALAFGGQPTNLGRLMRLESEDEARAEAQAFERQGLRLQTMAAQRDGVKFALDMLEKISPENRKQIIPRLTVTVPGIDQEAFAEELQSLADSEIASIKGTLDALTPEDQIALSAIPGFNDLSLRERSKFAQKMIDSRIEIATAVAKQSALAPGRIAEAGATAEATEAAKAEFREPKGKAVNLLLPDGRRATGRELPGGELKIVGEGGALVSAPPGALKMTLQAAPGELPDAALNRKVVQIETTQRNFARMVQETFTFLDNPKTVLGGAGASIRFAQGLIAQASQLARAFSSDHFEGGTGKDLSVAEILEPRRYEFDGMQAIAAANVRTKANVVAMAYIIARARDPSGRLSDFDVQVSMETLGFQSNDKEIIKATLADRLREVTENSANFIESATGKRPDLPTLPPAPATRKPKVFTIEELEALSRGSN